MPPPVSGPQQAGLGTGSRGGGRQAPSRVVLGSKGHPISGSVRAKTCSGALLFRPAVVAQSLFLEISVVGGGGEEERPFI